LPASASPTEPQSALKQTTGRLIFIERLTVS
jgi:hypothetical protein